MSKTKHASKGGYRPLAEQLRKMAADSGLSTNALAVASGVPQPVLHRFVTGDRDDIRLSTADRLCEFFGVKLTKPGRV